MTPQTLKQMLSAGPVAIEFGNGVNSIDDAYPELHMRAHVTAVILDEREDMAKITVDYTAFEDYNLAFEAHDYFDKHGQPTLTAREAGLYEPTEVFYFDLNGDIDDTLTVLDDLHVKLLDAFKQSGEASYVRWLEGIVGKTLGLQA